MDIVWWLEVGIRADCLDTKEKPFTCFCGAAFTRRDLLKRHHRITHEENPDSQSTVGLISPNSQEDRETIEQQQQQQNEQQTLENSHPVVQPQQYNVPPAPRPDVAPLPDTAAGVEQWTGSQHEAYLQQSQPIIQPDSGHAALGGHAEVTHDADILEAAQLLLPGYRDPQPPAQPIPYFPEELNHFQEFTHFLDSIGLPAEWLPVTEPLPPVPNTIPSDAPARDQFGPPHRDQPDRSRADSPFRSWLPSVPPGDQSIGSLSDYGIFYLSVSWLEEVRINGLQSRLTKRRIVRH